MPLVELGELHEARDGQREEYKLINMIRNRVNGALGDPEALDVAATTGFATVPTMAGIPIGVPDDVFEDRAACVLDTLNLRAYFFIGGVWRFAQLV